MDMGMSDPSMMGTMGGDTTMAGAPMSDPSMMGAMGDEQPNPYEADFDAGVEADEESDPKTFIQQLTGKLCQSLRKYNENQPQPDEDLNKYVAGMVVAQAVKNMSPDDANEVMTKIKDESAENMDANDGQENAMQDPNAMMADNSAMQQGAAPMMENIPNGAKTDTMSTSPSRAPKHSPYAPVEFSK